MTQRMISRDSQRHGLSPRCDARNEITDLGQTPAQACSRVDRRRLRHTEALQSQLPLQTLNIFTEEDTGTLVVPRGEVDLAKPCTRHDLQGGVSARRGTGERALTPVDGSISITGQAEVVGQIRGRSSEPSLIARAIASVSASRRCLNICWSPPRGWSALRRSKRTSIACSRRAGLSGKCWRASNAWSKYAAASRSADRSSARVPARRRYGNAFVQLPPFTAWYASRSICS